MKITENANDDSIAKEFSKLLKDLLMKRPGLNFYALRHTFQTLAEGAGDIPAVRAIGHVDASMSATYREFVSEERLRALLTTSGNSGIRIVPPGLLFPRVIQPNFGRFLT